ncbi:hypothetical protein EMCRGX_G016391 [Ephydatia muelleri]
MNAFATKSFFLFFLYMGRLPASYVAGSLYDNPCGTSATQTHDGDIAVPLSESSNSRPAPPAITDTGGEDAVGETEEAAASKRAATANRSWRWTNGVIPYNVSQDYTASERELIRLAMNHWMNNTCIRFRQRRNEVDYVNIFSGDCCASYVGRTGGLQGVSLNRAQCMTFPTVVHELGHAVGFWHEQSRPDRDNYVSIAYENVLPGTEHNFDVMSSRDINSLGVGYDYNSIMHYSRLAWSFNGQPTINSADPAYAGAIGGAKGLSVLDSYQTNLLYGCDSDECALHVDRCDKNADCRNVIGGLNSYQCQCKPGYYGNGTSCISAVLIDECQQGTHVCQHNCTDTSTSYNCSCGTGYQLISKGTCTDINECRANNGGCSQLCENIVGSYRCSCYNGYVMDARTHECSDINECLLMNGGCSQLCKNTPGSYQCTCGSGYTLGSDNRTCADVNECSISNGGCAHLCQNAIGNYSCSCRPGYYLSSNGKTCIFQNECLANNGGCAQICVNILGYKGSHVCLCRTGYTKGADNVSCYDINECSASNGGCSQACVNSVGSYNCYCVRGYHLSSDMRTCKDIDECQSTTVCTQRDLLQTLIMSATTLSIYGGQGGGDFSFTGLQNGATLQKIGVWVGESTVKAVRVWLTDGRVERFGDPSNCPYKEFEFEAGESF